MRDTSLRSDRIPALKFRLSRGLAYTKSLLAKLPWPRLVFFDSGEVGIDRRVKRIELLLLFIGWASDRTGRWCFHTIDLPALEVGSPGAFGG